MDLLLTVFLSAASVIGSIFFVKSMITKTIGMALKGSISQKMLDSGEKEKVKKFDKEPLRNPDVTNGVNYNANMTGNVSFNQNRVGDFGVNPDITEAEHGENGSVIRGLAMLGISPALVGGELAAKGVKKVAPKVSKEVGKQISKPMEMAKNKVYTLKNKVGEQINPVMDTAKQKIAGVRSTVGKKLEPVTQGIHNAQDKVILIGGKIRNTVGDAITSTAGYHIGSHGARMIKKAVTGRDLMTDRFYAQSGISLSELASSKNVSSDIELVESKPEYNRLHLDKNQMGKVTAWKNIITDPENDGLNTKQKRELYSLMQLQNDGRLINSDNSRNFNDQGNKDYKDLCRAVIKEFPNLSLAQKSQIIIGANQLGERREKKKELIARSNVAQITDVNKENKKSLDNLLKDTSSKIPAQFNNFMEENYNHNNLSDTDIKRIEQKARENIRAREGLTAEQIETEYKELVEKLKEEKIKSNMDSNEEVVKEMILRDPELAKGALGEEGYNALIKQMEENVKKIESMVQQEKLKQSKLEDEAYRKEEKRRNSINSYELYKERMRSEMRNDVISAANSLYPNEINNDTPQPQRIIPFTTRQVREDESSKLIV